MAGAIGIGGMQDMPGFGVDDDIGVARRAIDRCAVTMAAVMEMDVMVMDAGFGRGSQKERKKDGGDYNSISKT
jgi:hypothetical protein